MNKFILLLIVVAIIAISIYFFAFNITFFVELVKGLGYAGALISGFLGSVSLFISVFPSYIVIPMLATQLNPLAVGILAGIGAGFGQFLHYYIGLGGRAILPSKYDKTIDKWKKHIEKYGVALIFLFAATPLSPDDLVWIPLGMMKYPKVKALLAGIAGKIVLCLFYAYIGFYGWKFLTPYLH